MSDWPAGSTSAADVLAGEADEFVGHHLAEAVVLRRDMGEIDDGALAQEAAKRLAAVAWRLMATDLTSASALYARAADLVPGTVAGLDLRCRHGVALFRAQEFGARPRHTRRGARRGGECGDRGLFLRARLAWLEVAAHTEDDLAMAEIDAAAAEALDYFESTGDDEGLAYAYAARRKRLNIGGPMGTDDGDLRENDAPRVTLWRSPYGRGSAGLSLRGDVLWAAAGR